MGSWTQGIGANHWAVVNFGIFFEFLGFHIYIYIHIFLYFWAYFQLRFGICYIGVSKKFDFDTRMTLIYQKRIFAPSIIIDPQNILFQIFSPYIPWTPPISLAYTLQIVKICQSTFLTAQQKNPKWPTKKITLKNLKEPSEGGVQYCEGALMRHCVRGTVADIYTYIYIYIYKGLRHPPTPYHIWYFLYDILYFYVIYGIF